jgi:hypothetical protein
MKRDIKSKTLVHTVNNLPGFLDIQNANLFVMYVKARFLIKFEQTKSYVVPIFYLIISSCSMIDLIQLLIWYNSLKSGRTSKIMVPPESLPQYL